MSETIRTRNLTEGTSCPAEHTLDLVIPLSNRFWGPLQG